MPQRDFYEGLDLASALEAFAEHHSEKRTRHITIAERRMLLQAVAELRKGPKATPDFG